MTITIEDRSGIKYVQLSGQLSGEEGAELVRQVAELLGARGTKVILDLAGVPFINSAGLGALVRVTAHANTQEGRVVLVNLSNFVTNVLQVTKLDQFFIVCPTIEAAEQRLR